MWIEISKKEFTELSDMITDSYLNPNNHSFFKEKIYFTSGIRILKESSICFEGMWKTEYYKNIKFFND